jgi:protein-disulfide isomerase
MRQFYLLFLSIVFLTTQSFAKTTSFNDEQKRAIEQIVHNYLVKNPQVLVDMSQSLQKMHDQEMSNMQAVTKNLIGKYQRKILALNRPTIGNIEGDVQLIEFFDYQCGHCKQMKSVIDELIKTDPNLKVMFIDWPIFGDDSTYAVKAVLAAQNQNEYIKLHNALLDQENPLSRDKILVTAKSIGIDVKKLEQDVSSVNDLLDANLRLAKELKLVATPAFIVINRNNKKYDFVLGQVTETELQKIISEVRSK